MWVVNHTTVGIIKPGLRYKSFYSYNSALKYYNKLLKTCKRMYKLYEPLTLLDSLRTEKPVVKLKRDRETYIFMQSLRNNRLVKDFRSEARSQVRILWLLEIQKLNWPNVISVGELYTLLSSSAFKFSIQKAN